MPAFIDKDGVAVEVFRGVAFVDREGIARSANWLDVEPPEVIAAAGIVDIAEPPTAPEGKRNVPGPLENRDGVPTRSYTLEDAPPPAPLRYQIAKADIWRRATDAEADAMDAALNTAPVRLRRAYDAAQFIDSGDEWFGELSAGIAAAVGEARAAELLAPTV